MNMPKKPTVFIGSSSEAIGIVDAFQSHLEDVAEVRPWRYGIFKKYARVEIVFWYIRSIFNQPGKSKQ